jgi:retron-type reverse transcriptase
MDNAKPFCISKREVWEAYKRVKANQGATGVDGQSIEQFEEDLENNLYRLWNRMCSGSYFPLPVRRVDIPKGDGQMRPLGIPTVSDRIAQMVVQRYLEPIVEPLFHDDSYGYRPGRSAHQALSVARQRCWRYDWVLDLDIKSFFDTIDWELLLRALRRHTDCKWVLLYVERWLKAPVCMPDGTLAERSQGTPQGAVISPLLANLFLHYAFDRWMAVQHPDIPFERYADDRAPRRRGKEIARSNGSSFAAREMRERPSGSGCRTGAQTTGCCSGLMIGVVSETEKAGPTRQVSAVKTNASEPSMTCRKRRNVHRNRAPVVGSGQTRGKPADGSSGDRHEDGVSTAQALVRNVGTLCLDAKRELQVADP